MTKEAVKLKQFLDPVVQSGAITGVKSKVFLPAIEEGMKGENEAEMEVDRKIQADRRCNYRSLRLLGSLTAADI